MILIYFPEYDSTSIVKENCVVNSSDSALKRGSKVGVKERSKVYNGVVIEVIVNIYDL